MIKQQLGEPIEGEYPPEFIERYPELTGRRSLLHVHSSDHVAAFQARRHVRAGNDLPEDGVLAVQIRADPPA